MQGVKERILCFDVGDKRIGIAVSSPFGATAQPLATLSRTAFKADCEKIWGLLAEYSAGKIVIGLPLDLEGKEGPQAKKVRFFAEGLQKFLHEKNTEAEVKFWDESLSSQEAESLLLEADLSRKKRRKVIDKVAAALILQSYLDSHG